MWLPASVAWAGDGRVTFDQPLPGGEPPRRRLFIRLMHEGKVLAVVDQPVSIGPWR
jgi:hypothetical protein